MAVRELRINDRIRARTVRLIAETGDQLGIMPVEQALDIARERDLDLVEVAPTADPPVCRLLDYGRYKYEQAKKGRESRKHQQASVMHEMRLRPNTNAHDFAFKMRTVEKFLAEGHKVKFNVLFRGREREHPEIAQQLLERVQDNLKEVSSVEKPPGMEGRFMTLVLAPVGQKQEKKKQGAETEDA